MPPDAERYFRLWKQTNRKIYKERCCKALQTHLYTICIRTLGRYDPDVAAAGNKGIAHAINTYSPGKGAKLTTYASHCARCEMLKYLYNNFHHIREPAYVHTLRNKARKLNASTPEEAQTLLHIPKWLAILITSPRPEIIPIDATTPHD